MKIILAILFTSTYLITFSQSADQLIREGNRLYEEKNYKMAMSKYQEALKKNPDFFKGLYNLGDALYQNEEYDKAIENFERAVALIPEKSTQAAAYHNIGNAYLKNKALEKSIEAYKKSLLLNPQDEDTRYNLAYAQALMKAQEQQDNQDQQNQQDKKDEDKKQNQQKQQDEKQEQNQKEQKNQDKNESQQKQQEAPQQGQMTKEQAERLLKAIENNERKVQERVNDQKGTPVRVKGKKDW